jgi:hypothetical protein
MARCALIVTSLFLVVPAASACSVPVFRYALEQWPAAKYELLVFQDRPLSDDDRDTIRAIKQSTAFANLTVRQVNLAGKVDDVLRTIADRDGRDIAFPRAVLRYPDSGPKIAGIWSCSLTALKAKNLTDSPTRRAIFDNLTNGYAAVVLLLVSGDKSADDAAREMLRIQLPAIAQRMELPKKTDDGPQVQSLIPLRIEFPVVEVARDADDVLTRILIGSEDGLDKVRGPIAFPVFGRGRALCSLSGADLQKPTQLQRSLDFLCHACSCQAKELNPGIDLLIAGNWEAILAAEAGPLPRIVSVPGIETKPGRPNGTNVAEQRSAPPMGYSAVEVVEEKMPARGPRWNRLGVLGAGCLIILAMLLLARRRQPAQRNSD